MAKIKTRLERHLSKHRRVRRKVLGTPERPRLCVYRSLLHIYAQLIDDASGVTLVSASSLDKEIRTGTGRGKNKEAAKKVGEVIAQRALAKGLDKAVFDRGGYLYHGRVKSLAEGARSGGLKF